jgi:hypothetical protein
MADKRSAGIGLLVLLFATSVPAIVFAQSAITGQVKDATGLVLPGVTIEASSPALIERTRSATTDGQGVYRIVDLRPGVYKLTFSLEGFNTAVRDAIELPASFTATVNAELKIGSVEETVVVSGQSPQVDVTNVAQQTVMNKTQMDFIPAARISTALSALLPGVQTLGFADPVGRQQLQFAVHDSRTGEQLTTIDGFSNRMANGVGGPFSTFYNNQATVQETTVTTSGAGAEQAFAGIWTNIIPKEGGNTLSGQLFVAWANSSFGSSNLNDTLRSRGINNVAGLKSLHDFNPAIGGAIIRDRLWFYSSYRHSAVAQNRAGIYYNSTPTGWAYTPDLTKPAWIESQDNDYNTRLTWQLSPRNKLYLYYDRQPHVITHRNFDSLTAPEATNYTPYQPNYFTQAVWKSPATSRLLLEAGIGGTSNDYDTRLQTGQDPAVSVAPDTISVLESSTGLRYRRSAADTSDQSPAHHINNQATIRASATYVTGSHSFKTGIQLLRGSTVQVFNAYSGDLQYTFLNGVPRSITEAAVPVIIGGRINGELGIFAQDQWKLHRMTFNLGIRYDGQNNQIDAVDLPAGRWVPARSFPTVKNAPNWKDIDPRFGVAWDLFGNGRDAVKVMLNRYVAGQGATGGVTTPMAPASRAVLTVTRTWTDSNKDFVPDCDLTNPLANGECAQISDLNFGQTINPKANQYDPALLSGWGVRGYNWETSATYQHEFTQRISAMVGYFRRSYGNFTVTNNLEVTPSDYDPFCVTAPVDARLPGGGGNQMCGYYDVKPALFGRVNNFVTLATDSLGKQTEVFNGVDVNVSVRAKGGSQVSGGMSLGRTATNNCQVVDSPQQALFCAVKPPFQPNIKFSGTYAVPWWGIRLSGSLQNVPGANITATYTATNSQILPSLGRNLAAGANGTANLPLIQAGTLYENRQTELDIRLTKGFTYGHVRLLGNLDIFNALNLAGIDAVNTTYGPNWLTPTRIQGPRYMKLSAQLDF